MRSLITFALLLFPVLLSAVGNEEVPKQISCQTSSAFPPVQGNILRFDSMAPEQIRIANGDWTTNGRGWFEQTFDVKVTALEQPPKGTISLLLFELKANKSVPQSGADQGDSPQSIHFLFSRETGKGSGMIRFHRGSSAQVECNEW